MFDYYSDYGVREICRGVKERNQDCILEMAAYLSKQVTSESILVPIPQHTGRAEYTKEISDLISKWTGAKVADVLRCKSHEPGYILKKRGAKYSPRFYLKGEKPVGKIVLIDNVIATGATIREAERVIGNCDVQVYACDYGAITT